MKESHGKIASTNDLIRLFGKTDKKDREALADLSNIEPFEGYVCFLDVLGVRGKVFDENSADATVASLMALAYDIHDYIGTKNYITFYSVSDSYILVCKDYKCVDIFLNLIGRAVWNALSRYNLLLRGAIAYGNLYLPEDENFYVMIAGRAYMEAYLCQEETAQFPRIVFAESVDVSKLGDNVISDYDGVKTLNYVKMLRKEITNEDISKVKSFIEEESKKLMNKGGHINIRRKHAWILKYLEENA